MLMLKITLFLYIFFSFSAILDFSQFYGNTFKKDYEVVKQLLNRF